jgi:hypothetical protein
MSPSATSVEDALGGLGLNGKAGKVRKICCVGAGYVGKLKPSNHSHLALSHIVPSRLDSNVWETMLLCNLESPGS